ncbi:MAG: PAS domain-containing sensor histidine kinase [Bacillota bacterium]
MTENLLPQMMSTILQSVDNAIVITDYDSRIIWVNKSFFDLTGYTLSEVKGHKTNILKSGFQSEIFYKKLWKHISNMIPWRGELINKKKNGEFYFEEMSITPITTDSKTYFVAVKKNITKRKNDEKQQKNEKELFENLFFSSPIPMGLYNASTYEVSIVNNAWENFWGIRKNDIIGKSIVDLALAAIRFSRDINAFFNTENSEQIKTRNLTILNNKKQIKHCILYTKYLEYNQISHICHIYSDITNIKSAEKKLQDINNKLYESNESLKNFSCIAGHDLKSPLNKINFLAKNIQKNHDLCNENLDKIIEYSQHSLDLVEHLSKWSKIERVKINFENINIYDSLKMALDRLDIDYSVVSIEIKNKLPNIYCDKYMMSFVFQNLISNAIKYNDKNKTIIEISSNEDKDFYFIDVKDNGPGIPDRYLSKIFEPFSSFSNNGKPKGSGIGLFICKKLIEKHNAKIIPKSVLKGKGTTFTLILHKNPPSEKI